MLILLQKLDEQALINWEAFFIDPMQIRASRTASGAEKKGDQKNQPTMR